MEENPFSEANSYSGDKEVTSIWYDLKADNCVHKNLPVDSYTRRIKSTLSYPVSSIPCLTPEESSPRSHTQFV